MICPNCGSEYREGFFHCKSCDLALVDPASLVTPKGQAPRELLKDVETMAMVVAGGLPSARENERKLLAADIACYIETEEMEGAAALGTANMRYALVVAKADQDRVAEFLRDEYVTMMEKEGIGELVQKEVNLEDDVIECPACGHRGALVDGACADCELFLGAP